MAKTISHLALTLFFGAAMLAGAWYTGGRAASSSSWTTVTASVKSAKAQRRMGSGKKRDKYAVEVAYSYVVNG